MLEIWLAQKPRDLISASLELTDSQCKNVWEADLYSSPSIRINLNGSKLKSMGLPSKRL